MIANATRQRHCGSKGEGEERREEAVDVVFNVQAQVLWTEEYNKVQQKQTVKKEKQTVSGVVLMVGWSWYCPIYSSTSTKKQGEKFFQ